METDTSTIELRAANEALLLCERRHEALLASTADYIYSVSLKRGKWVATSHGAGCEAITGFTSQELDTDPSLWYRMIHEEDRPATILQLAQIMTTAVPQPLEHRIIHKTGGVRWVRNIPIPQRNFKGRVVSYDGFISDITSRKKAELDARRSQADLTRSDETLKISIQELRAKAEKLEATELELFRAAKLECIGKMAAGVAHEVKNPLQTILMGLDFLAQNVQSPQQPVLEALRDMRQAVTRASAIIHGLLELAANRRYQTEASDLNTLLTRGLDLIHYELEARQTKVLREFCADLPAVPIDSAKMEQAFINIFMNAVQAMPSGGILRVTTRSGRFGRGLELSESAFPDFQRGDNLAVIEVHDTGPGVSDADLPKLFEPFFTTKREEMGTGLGLSIVKKIMDLHFGAISIRNAPEGGTIVTIVLRIEQENEA